MYQIITAYMQNSCLNYINDVLTQDNQSHTSLSNQEHEDNESPLF